MKKQLLDLTEPRSAIAAVLPTILALLYSMYKFGTGNINYLIAIIFFITVVLMQLGVNVWNNIVDYNKNSSEWNDSYNNSIKNGEVGKRLAYRTLLVIIAASLVLGLSIVAFSKHGILILILGLIGALVAFLYSGGKYPISSSPFGEIASGVTMGFVILLAAVISFSQQFSTAILKEVIVLSIMPIAIIANIMFANNISDREEDKIQGRHTLVQYLGLNKSLILFASIYGIGYISIAIVVLLKILPVTALLVFLSFPLVFNNVKIFSKEPIKSKNFVLSIKSAAIICLTLFIGIMIGILI